ncbi:MAG: metallophosphoesterase [Fibrobacter sp.]|mgnify:CR=1 FL=1|nr:metallophosphoesterase [Fibrobacter sp.]
MLFIFILLLALFVIFNLRRIMPGYRGLFFSAFLVIVTIGSFLLSRTYYFVSIVQSALVIWISQILWLFLIFDLVLLISRVIRRQRQSSNFVMRSVRVLFVVSVLLTLVFVGYGIQHNRHYKVRSAEIALLSVDSSSGQDNFSVLFFSDLHLDMLFAKEKLERLINSADSLKPDFIVFGGDFADVSDSLLVEQGYMSLLQQLSSKARDDAIAVGGNHEAYMQRRGSDLPTFLENSGFRVLEDSTLCFDKACFTGRKDFQLARMTDEPRKNLAEILPHSNLPWILVDHQPKGIEAEHQGRLPDFAMSGHTHGGQFFPVTVLIRFIWSVSEGIGRLDGVRWLVSSGFDCWGPPVRVLSDSEIWLIKFVK